MRIGVSSMLLSLIWRSLRPVVPFMDEAVTAQADVILLPDARCVCLQIRQFRAQALTIGARSPSLNIMGFMQ